MLTRFYSPRVDRLEDRCVPAADPLSDALPVLVEPTTAETTDVVDESVDTTVVADDGNSYVVESYDIESTDSISTDEPAVTEPQSDATDSGDPLAADDLSSTDWTSTDEPAATEPEADATDSGDPLATNDDGTTFVIDPYLIDPNDPTTPTKPADDNPDGWISPDDQSIVPPIDDPFWY